MLEPDTFEFIVKNAPLVSIDICLVNDGRILLGNRNFDPLKGMWFTPGGRVFKNELWTDCMRRIVFSELGLVIENLPNFKLMGVWDHFYINSFMDENVSTHYVNFPHYCILDEIPKLFMDNQHNDLQWFDLDEVAGKNGFHKYMQNYASWLIKEDKKND